MTVRELIQERSSKYVNCFNNSLGDLREEAFTFKKAIEEGDTVYWNTHTIHEVWGYRDCKGYVRMGWAVAWRCSVRRRVWSDPASSVKV